MTSAPATRPALRIAILLALLWIGSPVAIRAGMGVDASVEQLSAALVISFARYAEWPAGSFESSSVPIVIGVMSDESLAQTLEQAGAGRRVGSRPLAVRRVHWQDRMAGLHLLFVGEPEQRRLTIVLANLRSLDVLTVSRIPEFGAAGGMITLRAQAGRVGFSVNPEASAATGVKLTSFLLSHAIPQATHAGPGRRSVP